MFFMWTFLKDAHDQIISITSVITAIIASLGIIATYITIKRVKRKNLTNVLLIVIDDGQSDEHKWYVTFYSYNLKYSVRSLSIEFANEFKYINDPSEDNKKDKKLKFRQNTVNKLTYYNISNNDKFTICLRIPKVLSAEYLENMNGFKCFTKYFTTVHFY